MFWQIVSFVFNDETCYEVDNIEIIQKLLSGALQMLLNIFCSRENNNIKSNKLIKKRKLETFC